MPCLLHHLCAFFFLFVLLIEISLVRLNGLFLLGLGLMSPFLLFFTSAVYLADPAVSSNCSYCIVIHACQLL